MQATESTLANYRFQYSVNLLPRILSLVYLVYKPSPVVHYNKRQTTYSLLISLFILHRICIRCVI